MVFKDMGWISSPAGKNDRMSCSRSLSPSPMYRGQAGKYKAGYETTESRPSSENKKAQCGRSKERKSGARDSTKIKCNKRDKHLFYLTRKQQRWKQNGMCCYREGEWEIGSRCSFKQPGCRGEKTEVGVGSGVLCAAEEGAAYAGLNADGMADSLGGCTGNRGKVKDN